MLVSAWGMLPNVARTRTRLILRRRGRGAHRPAFAILAVAAGGLAVGALLEYFLDPKGRPCLSPSAD